MARPAPRRPLRQPLALRSSRSTPIAGSARSIQRSTASSWSTSTTRSRMACSPSRSAAPGSRGATSRRTGPLSGRRTRCTSSRRPFERGTKSVRITAGRELAGIRQRRVFSWSPGGATTDRSGSRSSRARRVCHCASWRPTGTFWRNVRSDARIGVAGGAVFVRERADRSRRHRRNRGRRTRRGARRLRVADARRRAQGAACCVPTCSRRSVDWRPRSSAGRAAHLPRPTSGRTASVRSPRASTTRTKYGAATRTTTASAQTSTSN